VESYGRSMKSRRVGDESCEHLGVRARPWGFFYAFWPALLARRAPFSWVVDDLVLRVEDAAPSMAFAQHCCMVPDPHVPVEVRRVAD